MAATLTCSQSRRRESAQSCSQMPMRSGSVLNSFHHFCSMHLACPHHCVHCMRLPPTLTMHSPSSLTAALCMQVRVIEAECEGGDDNCADVSRISGYNSADAPSAFDPPVKGTPGPSQHLSIVSPLSSVLCNVLPSDPLFLVRTTEPRDLCSLASITLPTADAIATAESEWAAVEVAKVTPTTTATTNLSPHYAADLHISVCEFTVHLEFFTTTVL
jgi:hypothetical protein